jgi:lysozyme
MPILNAAGLALIKQFEGLSLTSYADPGTGAEPYTIGYGHTGPDVHPNMTISEQEAQALLQSDVLAASQEVAALIEVELTPNEFAALVSWQYNTGALAETGGLALLNARQFEAAWDDHLCLYTRGGNGTVLPGLVRRRAAERALFFTAHTA